MNMMQIIVVLLITCTMALQSRERYLSPVAIANRSFFSDGTVVRIIYGLYDVDGPNLWDVPPEIAWKENFQQDADDPTYWSTSVLRYDIPIGVSGWTWDDKETRSARLGIIVSPWIRGCSYWRDAGTGWGSDDLGRKAPGEDTSPGYQLCDDTDAQVFAEKQLGYLTELCERESGVHVREDRKEFQCCQTNWEASIFARRAVSSSRNDCVKRSAGSANEFMVRYRPSDVIAVFYTAFLGESPTLIADVCTRARSFLNSINAINVASRPLDLVQLNLPFLNTPKQNGAGQGDMGWTTRTEYSTPFQDASC